MRGTARRTAGRVIAVVTLALTGCRASVQSPTATPEVVPLYFSTTDTTAPVLQHLATAYTGDRALVAIIDRVDTPVEQESDTDDTYEADTVMSQYRLTTYLPASDMWAAPLGQDGIAIIVNPSLALPGLTARDLRRLFTGQVQNWSVFIDSDLPVTVVSVGQDNAVRMAFEYLVMGERQITLNARLAPTSQAVLDMVASIPGAISFISLTQLDERVQAVPVSATLDDLLIFPTWQTIAENLYPLRMPLLIVGQQPPEPGDGYYEFILWAQGTEGQKVIAQHYAPLLE